MLLLRAAVWPTIERLFSAEYPLLLTGELARLFWRRGRRRIAVGFKQRPAVIWVDPDLDRIRPDKLTLVVHAANVGIHKFGRQFDVEKIAVIKKKQPIPSRPPIPAHSYYLAVVVHVGKKDCRTANVFKAWGEIQSEMAVVINKPVVLQRLV